jgi:hypothetical protein
MATPAKGCVTQQTEELHTPTSVVFPRPIRLTPASLATNTWILLSRRACPRFWESRIRARVHDLYHFGTLAAASTRHSHPHGLMSEPSIAIVEEFNSFKRLSLQCAGIPSSRFSCSLISAPRSRTRNACKFKSNSPYPAARV